MMPPRPKLSLCIPTSNHAGYLKGALESGLREAECSPPGTVEVLVCDNASFDETQNVISGVRAVHPGLRSFRNDENLGFDQNYLRCVHEARGEFVWVMGDDDEWQPGCIARVLREVDAGADAILCLSETCDLDLNPVSIYSWYLNPDAPSVRIIESKTDLVNYFDDCVANASAFGFISVTIFNKDRFLASKDILQAAIGTGYIHLAGMTAFLLRPLRLHYIAEALVRNRVSDNHNQFWTDNLYGRWMHDFRAWGQIADSLFNESPEISSSFFRILKRNHDCNTFLPRFRLSARSEEAWLEAVPYLLRAGFSATRIAALEAGFREMQNHALSGLKQLPHSLNLETLPFLARETKAIAVLALGGPKNITDGAQILATLRGREGNPQIRVYCTSECSNLLDGFDLQLVEPDRYASDVIYQDVLSKDLADFAPELLVNLDPERGVQADHLVLAARPSAGIAYDLPASGQAAGLIEAANSGYTGLVPRAGGPLSMLAALGLPGVPPTLWPPGTSRDKARTLLEVLGWDPGRTLAVLVDHPTVLEDPTVETLLAEAVSSGWTLAGVGGQGQGTYSLVESTLRPWKPQSANLTGVLDLGSTAALLKLCGAFLGGTPLLQSMARACGCAPFQPRKAE